MARLTFFAESVQGEEQLELFRGIEACFTIRHEPWSHKDPHKHISGDAARVFLSKKCVIDILITGVVQSKLTMSMWYRKGLWSKCLMQTFTLGAV